MKDMAKVALELQPCCGNRSGIGTYAYELAKRMKSGDGLEFQGNYFDFLGRNRSSEVLRDMPMALAENRMMPYGVYRRIWDVLPIQYDNLFPCADLSVFFNYIVPPHIGGRVITTIFDLTYIRLPETMDQKNYRRISRNIAGSIARSDRIITISEFSKQEIMELLGIEEERIAVIPCAPTFSKEQVESESVAQKFKISSPYILYVGTIEPRKNLVRLLKAFERLKRETGIPHQLVLAGGSGWNNAEIYETAAGLSCADAVIFTGYVSAAEKNTLYQGAAAFAFPSLYEGFGIPPLEAMHFGCPVVAAKAASLPEVVGDAACLVEPLDEVSVAEGLYHVLYEADYRAELIKKGYQQEKKYTWDDSAERLMALCREVLA